MSNIKKIFKIQWKYAKYKKIFKIQWKYAKYKENI